MSQKERDAFQRIIEDWWSNECAALIPLAAIELLIERLSAVYPDEPPAQSSAEGGLRAELLSILRHFTTVKRGNPLIGYDEAIGYIRSRLKVAAQPTAQTPEGET